VEPIGIFEEGSEIKRHTETLGEAAE